MALPAGVSTFELEFGKTFDFEGNSLATTITVVPSHELVWEATGDRVIPRPLTVTAAAGEFGSILLPHTDQAGFVDTKGNAITDWWYRITSRDSAANGQSIPGAPVRVLQATSDVTSVDLDMLPTDGVVGPVGSVAGPAVTSVNGGTGAVTVTAAGVGAVPNTSEGREALAASSELTGAIAAAVDASRTVGAGTWATLGDSITSYNQPVNFQQPGWFWRLVMYSRGRMRPEPSKAVFATGGFTLQNIIDTHLPGLEALTAPPGFVICGGGSNDLAAAGGATYAADPQLTKDSLDEIISRVLALGAQPVLVKVPPRSGSVQIAANVLDWNAHVEETARTRGFKILDMFTPLSANPADGGARKPGTYQSDDADTTHPNKIGHDYIARYNAGLADLSASRLDLSAPLWETALLADGVSRFLTDADSNGISDGWGTGGTTTGVTFAREAVAAGEEATGFWQRINVPANTAASGWIQTGIGTGWAPGDRLRIRTRLRAAGVNGSTYGYSIGLVCVSPTSTQGVVDQVRDMPDGEVDAYATIPAGTTGLYVRILWATVNPSAQVLRIANVRVDNLSVVPS
ncbi:SGNH/GDSL hydrolase family protein [Microbacterium sp. NPDC078428]|uniref:SGNH/GDSL hydrolase family protein n=1 Tax=Microbacterium sp. NPDC078428 TaxID=3364190 RepID=UPI0037CA7D98